MYTLHQFFGEFLGKNTRSQSRTLRNGIALMLLNKPHMLWWACYGELRQNTEFFYPSTIADVPIRKVPAAEMEKLYPLLDVVHILTHRTGHIILPEQKCGCTGSLIVDHSHSGHFHAMGGFLRSRATSATTSLAGARLVSLVPAM